MSGAEVSYAKDQMAWLALRPCLVKNDSSLGALALQQALTLVLIKLFELSLVRIV